MYIALLAVAIIGAVNLFLVLQRRNIRGGRSLVGFSIALIFWCVTYALFTLTEGHIWLALTYLVSTVAATCIFTFTLEYTNREEWLTLWSLVILAVEPLITQVLYWTNDLHHMFFSPSGLAGPWYWINATYTDIIVLMSLILLSQTFQHKSRQYMFQSITIFTALLVPILAKIMNLVSSAIIPNLELSPFPFAISDLLLIFCILRYQLLDISMVPREEVVERMSDGWMVINPKNQIVDLNKATEALIGISRDEIYGYPAEHILKNWPKINQGPEARELEIKGSVILHGNWRFLNVRVLPLIMAPDKFIGKLVLWRDITERKKSDDARQKARDEMFVLLHSISGAASQSLNLTDFLTESLYQIGHLFQSQASMIYLTEQGATEDDPPKFTLSAHHGLNSSELKHLYSKPEITEIIRSITEIKEPFFVADVKSDTRLPAPMRESDVKSLLIAPLITGDRVLGAIGLVRKSGASYGNDEITRLNVVTEELATFIYSDRQRQLAIALEERQRLVRDLHDSVTQKLYGLVALTEAAQASLESGTTEQSAKVLSRIAENARQALREMRLFLFQMKPVDLEHEGLISILHQRLAAVEGRADIKARLLTDDKINISLEKQVVLYYIAQEALNNVLKHANAKSVTVRLKKKRSAFMLEVVDDGCGFSKKTIDKGGMGLRIMQERAATVGGDVKIDSTPGKGTKVTATVGKDTAPSSAGGEKTNEKN